MGETKQNKCEHRDFTLQAESNAILTYRCLPGKEPSILDTDVQRLEDDVYIHCMTCGEDWIWIPASEARTIENGAFKNAVESLFGHAW